MEKERDLKTIELSHTRYNKLTESVESNFTVSDKQHKQCSVAKVIACAFVLLFLICHVIFMYVYIIRIEKDVQDLKNHFSEPIKASKQSASHSSGHVAELTESQKQSTSHLSQLVVKLIEGQNQSMSRLFDLVGGQKQSLSDFSELVKGQTQNVSRLFDLMEGQKQSVSRLAELLEGHMSDSSELVKGQNNSVMHLSKLVESQMFHLTELLEGQNQSMSHYSELLDVQKQSITHLYFVFDVQNSHLSEIAERQKQSGSYLSKLVGGQNLSMSHLSEIDERQKQSVSNLSELVGGQNLSISHLSELVEGQKQSIMHYFSELEDGQRQSMSHLSELVDGQNQSRALLSEFLEIQQSLDVLGDKCYNISKDKVIKPKLLGFCSNIDGCESPETIGGFYHCFKFVEVPVTWDKAVSECIAIHGYLAEIHDLATFEYLKKFVKTKNIEFWLGASDEKQEGVWEWETSGKNMSVTDWYGSKPDNWRGSEHFLQFSSYGYLNDAGTESSIAYYICQKDAYTCEGWL